MRVLLDVPLEGLREYLELYGHEIHTATGEKVIPDDQLLKCALENGFTLVIEDKKASRIAKGMGIRVVKVDMGLIAEGVQRELNNKYPGIVETFADELFSKKNGESISIPIGVLGSLLEGQKGGPVDVTRRAFGAYIEKRFKVKKPHTGTPSIMNKLLEFRTEGDYVIVIKKSQ
jgi:hypothetical protein